MKSNALLVIVCFFFAQPILSMQMSGDAKEYIYNVCFRCKRGDRITSKQDRIYFTISQEGRILSATAFGNMRLKEAPIGDNDDILFKLQLDNEKREEMITKLNTAMANKHVQKITYMTSPVSFPLAYLDHEFWYKNSIGLVLYKAKIIPLCNKNNELLVIVGWSKAEALK